MKQEEKKLLLIDLSARLPYGVICEDSRHGSSRITEIDTVEETVYCDDFDEYVVIENIKPYLRPMSSMTKEEKTLILLCNAFTEPRSIELKVDFYNKQYLDYCGLIEKGLALEAPEGMYKTE